jgi:ribose 5-phosphate isomerase B
MLFVAIGGDHAGFAYKQELRRLLKEQGIPCKDFGPPDDASVDYPDFSHPLATAVQKGHYDFGILICGSGNGVAITANKYPGVRAALCWNAELAALARRHNDANVLCLPARFISLDEAKECVSVFLRTPFEGGRHAARVGKISEQ